MDIGTAPDDEVQAYIGEDSCQSESSEVLEQGQAETDIELINDVNHGRVNQIHLVQQPQIINETSPSEGHSHLELDILDLSEDEQNSLQSIDQSLEVFHTGNNHSPIIKRKASQLITNCGLVLIGDSKRPGLKS